MDIFERNGTLQQMFNVGNYLQQARSGGSAFERVQGLTGLIAKILGMFG